MNNKTKTQTKTMEKQTKNVNNLTTFNVDTIRGFFDADGSFEAKVYSGKQKPISFHVNIIFTQQCPELLQDILDTTGAIKSRGFGPKKITLRNITTEAGTKTTANSVSVAFSSNAGQLLLGQWETNPPLAPTKYLDYRIAKILVEVSATQNSTALEVVKRHLPNVHVESELIAGLALLWLRFQMFGKVKSNKNPTLIPIETYYQRLGASQEQINESIAIGQQLYNPIKQDMANHSANLNIPENTLLGYHIGDGGFTIQTTFGSDGKSFNARFTWSVTDCSANHPYFLAIKKLLESKGIKPVGILNYKTYFKLVLSSQENCSKLVSLWKDKNLPQVRQNQYDCFNEALSIYTMPNFRKDLSLMEKFLELKWRMNPRTNKKKAGSLEEDLANIRVYFNKTQR